MFIRDSYVKVRKIDGKYCAVHLFNEKVLYDYQTGKVNKNLSAYSLNRVKKEIERMINFEKGLDHETN